MRVSIPLIPLLLKIATALPAIIKQIDADVKHAKEADTDGGVKVTAGEVTVIVGHIMEKLGEAVLPTVLKANGLSL